MDFTGLWKTRGNHFVRIRRKIEFEGVEIWMGHELDLQNIELGLLQYDTKGDCLSSVPCKEDFALEKRRRGEEAEWPK